MSLSLRRFSAFKKWSMLLVALMVLQSPMAASSENCFELVNSFLNSEQARVVTPAGSIADQHAELMPIMDKMIPPSLDFPKYILEFQQANQRTPTLREAIEFVYESRRELHQAYDELIETLYGFNQDHTYVFLKEVEQSRMKLSKFKDLDAMEREVMQNFTEGKSRVESLDIPIPVRDERGQPFFDEDYYRFLKDRTGLSNYSGEVGELLVYAKTPERVLAKGLRFDMDASSAADAYQSEIAQRVALLRSNLLAQDIEQLKAIVAQYTTERGGFLRHAQEFIDSREGETLVPSEVVDKIMNMITSKEIDLVSLSADRKITWTEVKAYNQRLTVEAITGGGSKKTIVDQLLEHKALRDLLGLEHSVELRFSSPLAGVDEAAREMIESLGFKVF